VKVVSNVIGTDSGSYDSLNAPAADIWISDQAGHVGLFNTATGALIHGVSTNDPLTDIAFIGNQMYGTSFTGLYSINDATGASRLLGNYNFTSGMNALLGDGSQLLAASFTSDNVYDINLATHKVTTIATIPYASAGDLAIANHKVYESVALNGVSTGGLYDVSDHKLIGEFKTANGAVVHNVFGLADNGSAMYAVAGHEIYSVNLANARLTPLSNDSASGIGMASGAAFANENLHG
jgi:hypothetical protein